MAGLETESTLTAYDPSWRDRAAQGLIGDGRASPERAAFVGGMLGSRGVGSTGVGLVDFTPVGVPFALNDAYRSARAGNYGTAALEAASALPAVRGLRAALDWATANNARQLARPGPQGWIEPYHGSPYQIDKVDLNRAGTTTGLKTQGHGFYATESKPLAEYFSQYPPRAGAGMPSPTVYRARIDARMEDLLDARRPVYTQSSTIRNFAEQPDIRKHLLPRDLNSEHLFGRQLMTAAIIAARESPWQKALRAIGVGKDPEIVASERMRRAGIPGMAYKEPESIAGSRGAQNYVIFDENLVDIVR